MSVPGYNRRMRWAFCLAATLALTGTGLCANLKDAATLLPCPPAAAPRVVEESTEIRLVPNSNRASFHFRGDSRELLTMIASSFGVSAQIEDSVKSQRVFFDIDDVDFYKVMLVAGQLTKSFWTP